VKDWVFSCTLRQFQFERYWSSDFFDLEWSLPEVVQFFALPRSLLIFAGKEDPIPLLKGWSLNPFLVRLLGCREVSFGDPIAQFLV